MTDLDAPLIGAFLNHLEAGRNNSVRTRNARLAAVHALFRHAFLHRPDDAVIYPKGPGNPTQALRSPPGQLPHRKRDRRTAGRA
jgi:hypothetical protein